MTGQPLRASPRSLAGFGVVLALVTAAGLATALSTTGGTKNHPAPAHAAGGSAATSALAAPKPVPAADLVVQQQHAGTVAWNRALLVTARHGTMRSIKVSDDAGHAVAGAVSTKATTWVSAATLVPSTTYTVHAVLSQPDGQVVQRSVRVTASPAPALLTVGVTPAAGATVGIGEPLVVYFHGHVANRAAAQRALQVTSSPPVAGAWRWFGDNEVHYRPAGYWPAGTTVTITPALHGVQLAPGTWGVTQPSVTFHIGPAHISVVDVASHIMTVYADGQVVRVLKASTGRDKYPTRRGVHIVLSKQPDKLMDSATVGIPRTSPDGYYEHVAWDVRISDGGAFVHSAPWSVKDQGVRNVSHGCVNLAPADGQWFFNFSQLGDVVNVLNSPSPPLLTDPGTEDWNYAWSTWQSGNADTP
jgi:lipoprotein-anchoring transpeptidase ErfK/SrfK